eukprot:382048-Hanusia_phi.AAC.1
MIPGPRRPRAPGPRHDWTGDGRIGPGLSTGRLSSSGPSGFPSLRRIGLGAAGTRRRLTARVPGRPYAGPGGRTVNSVAKVPGATVRVPARDSQPVSPG